MFVAAVWFSVYMYKERMCFCLNQRKYDPDIRMTAYYNAGLRSAASPFASGIYDAGITTQQVSDDALGRWKCVNILNKLWHVIFRINEMTF